MAPNGNDGRVRLIYVLNRLPPDESGHFLHVVRLLEHVARQFDIRITLVIENGPVRDMTDSILDVIALAPNSKALRQLALARTVLRLRLRGHRHAFVRISRPAAIVVSLLMRITGGSSLYWSSGQGMVERFSKQNGVDLLLYLIKDYAPTLLAMRLTHRFVTGPETMVDYYMHAKLAPPNRTFCLPNDVDPKAPGEPVSHATKLPVIVSVCRLSPVRNVQNYLPRVPELLSERGNQFDWVHVGGGPSLDEIAGAATFRRTIADCLTLAGDIRHEQVADYLKAADVFVLPSEAEGFPRVVLEAMSHRLPVVALEAGGIRDILPSSAQRFVYRRGDIPGLIDGLEELLDNPDLRHRLGRENSTFVERYSTDKVARQFAALVTSCESGLFGRRIT